MSTSLRNNLPVAGVSIEYMITIISATNRKDSNTRKVAQEYARMLSEQDIDHQILALDHLPASLLSPDSYDDDDPVFLALQEQYLFKADKYIFVLPEYNGSLPGILKLLIDAADIEKAFYFKKALLVGVATGRAGNLRGMDHLSGILLHMKMEVHWNRLPISRVTQELDDQNHFFREPTIAAVSRQVNMFAGW